jgi:hypothetical protein
MFDLSAPGSLLARSILERGLGAIYFVAFANAFFQFPALCGERGLDPAPRLLARARFWDAPSLFHLGYSDRRLRFAAVTGGLLALLVMLGLPQQAPLPVTMASWFLLWVLYQSIANVGGIFYGFGWETMLLEAGFLAIFLGNASIAPAWPIIFAFRWVAFRVELGAGLIKLRGDSVWRDLTAMNYHHQTQPMPNPFSRWFHLLPGPAHRLEAAGNFFAQLVLPFGLFLPQPVATIAALGMIGTQLYLVVSGNYAWLNWLTIVLISAGLSDALLGARSPFAAAQVEAAPLWFVLLVLAVSGLVLVLSVGPAKNLLRKQQLMNASFDPLHLVNTYGAFGSVSRKRLEVVVEGTLTTQPNTDSDWQEYEFKGKPGPVGRLPPQVAPYHLRLDWLMWFIPLSPRYAESWFLTFLVRLLEADRPTLALLHRDPFDGKPPAWVRARLFEYRFSTRAERRAGAPIWHRELISGYVRPISLRPELQPPAERPFLNRWVH